MHELKASALTSSVMHCQLVSKVFSSSSVGRYLESVILHT